MLESGLPVRGGVGCSEPSGRDCVCVLYVSEALLQTGISHHIFNLLMPNVNYSGRTAPLTSKIAFYIFIQLI